MSKILFLGIEEIYARLQALELDPVFRDAVQEAARRLETALIFEREFEGPIIHLEADEEE